MVPIFLCEDYCYSDYQLCLCLCDFMYLFFLCIHLCPVFETRVIPRISSYSWNKKKQQHFSNINSRVILRITHPKLSWHYKLNKLRTRKVAAHFDDNELAESYVDLFPPRHPRLFRDCANLLTDLDEVKFRARF